MQGCCLNYPMNVAPPQATRPPGTPIPGLPNREGLVTIPQAAATQRKG